MPNKDEIAPEIVIHLLAKPDKVKNKKIRLVADQRPNMSIYPVEKKTFLMKKIQINPKNFIIISLFLIKKFDIYMLYNIITTYNLI